MRSAPRGRSARFGIHQPVHWNGDRAMSANRRQGTMMTALLTNIRQLPTLHAESTFVLCPTA
ncbi:hypothetical protein ABIC01_008061 [Bradyrhizobium sp. RT4b]